MTGFEPLLESSVSLVLFCLFVFLFVFNYPYFDFALYESTLFGNIVHVALVFLTATTQNEVTGFEHLLKTRVLLVFVYFH